jgi:hypothetical protein
MSNQRFADNRSRAFGWTGNRRVLPQSSFHQMLTLEHVRSERTRRPFALLTLETDRSGDAAADSEFWSLVLSVLHATTRESDLTGWVEPNASIGILLTEVTPDCGLHSLRGRVSVALQRKLTPEQFCRIRFVTPARPDALRPPAHSPSVVSSPSHITTDLLA